MRLNDKQLAQYHEDGFLLVESALDQQEVEQLRASFQRDCETPGPHLVAEEDGSQVRAVYASHQRQPEFSGLVRDPRVLVPVQQLLTEDVYVYQFKINAKPAFGGEKWSWHQDYLAWRIADNLPAPRQVNIGVFLDDVTEFNGPVIFLPGSHRNGLVHEGRTEQAKSEQHLDPDDIALSAEQLAEHVDRRGMVSPKGPAGSIVFFSRRSCTARRPTCPRSRAGCSSPPTTTWPTCPAGPVSRGRTTWSAATPSRCARWPNPS